MFDISLIKDLCEQRNITIAELERATDIGNGVIRRWPDGAKAPRVDLLLSIADYFDVSLDYLISGITDGNKTKIEQRPDKSDNLSEQERELLELFRVASDDDKDVIWTLLRKYRQQAKKNNADSRSVSA